MPLVSDPNYADVFVLFDMHNLVGRCELGPAGIMRNRVGYPTNAVSIGLPKIRIAAEHAGLKHGLRVCLVFSAEENSDVRRAVYPEYKGNRPARVRDSFVVAGRRKIKYKDGRIVVFDYETDPVTVLHDTNVIAAGEVVGMVQREHNGVRDLAEVLQTIPCLFLHMPGNDGETDDALATFTHLARPKPCMVLTEDRDLWATMSERVTVFSKPEKTYSLQDLKEKFGIDDPSKLPLAKALYGDDSDNIVKVVAGVTQLSCGDLVSACERAPGEILYTDAFLREAEAAAPGEKGKRKRILEELVQKRDEIAALESLARLRFVKLAYSTGRRDPAAFSKHLEWYGINQAREKLLVFAQS